MVIQIVVETNPNICERIIFPFHWYFSRFCTYQMFVVRIPSSCTLHNAEHRCLVMRHVACFQTRSHKKARLSLITTAASFSPDNVSANGATPAIPDPPSSSAQAAPPSQQTTPTRASYRVSFFGELVAIHVAIHKGS